ncbi:MAG: hypothetical protein WDM80_13925 [Limisphaerales bacterium]
MKQPDATEPSARETKETGLPFFRSWRGVYLFVFVIFVLVVILLTIFSRWFA